MYNIELHIEKFVLHGFSPSDRYRIGEAVELELSRLFSEQGVPPELSHGGELAQLDGGTFTVLEGSGPETIGARVAQSVYTGFTK